MTPTRTLAAVGAVNWGLVGAGGPDLVALLTGTRFGRPNPATRLVYLVVGVAGAVEAADLARRAAA